MAVLFVSCGFAFGQDPSFQVIEGNFTWQEAKADAETRGGRLAVLNTQAKINYVKSYLTPSDSSVYIGLTDEVQEGQWKWITGEVLESNNWLNNQPGGGTSENYAIIYPNQSSGWNDLPTGLKRAYLLETGFLPVKEPTFQIIQGGFTWQEAKADAEAQRWAVSYLEHSGQN